MEGLSGQEESTTAQTCAVRCMKLIYAQAVECVLNGVNVNVRMVWEALARCGSNSRKDGQVTAGLRLLIAQGVSRIKGEALRVCNRILCSDQPKAVPCGYRSRFWVSKALSCN